MPTCKDCAYAWSYLETVKASFNLTNSMTCPNCSKKQFVTKKTIHRNFFLMMIPLTITFGIMFTFGPSLVIIAILLLLFIGMMGFYPFIVELSNEEAPI